MLAKGCGADGLAPAPRQQLDDPQLLIRQANALAIDLQPSLEFQGEIADRGDERRLFRPAGCAV
jgi:hypothetical protein